MKVETLVVALGLTVATSCTASAATTFSFQFDDSGGGPDGTVSPPIIGTGTFVSPVDLSPGTYALSSLTGFSIGFAFPLETAFSTSDIATPIDEVAVTITRAGPGVERLIFTENGSPPCCDNGPLGGSLDLVNSDGYDLSFEPTSFGGNNLYVALNPVGELYSGNYLALSVTSSVPEPSSWAMIVIGFIGISYCGLLRAKATTLG